jgi:hypothetical protein
MFVAHLLSKSPAIRAGQASLTIGFKLNLVAQFPMSEASHRD